MHEDTTVFIVEGVKRETDILESIHKTFFKHSKIKTIILPIELNIYML